MVSKRYMKELKRTLIWAIISLFAVAVFNSSIVFATESETSEQTETVTEETKEASTEVIDEIYNNVKDSVNPYWEDAVDNISKGMDGAGGAIDSLGLRFLTWLINAAKNTFVPVFIFAEVIGILVICLSGLNKSLKRGGYVLAIGVPVLWLVIIFGGSILISNMYY